MDIDRMKALAGVKEAKKPHASTLSLYDMDGLTIGELINHLQEMYDPNDRISVEEEQEYGGFGRDSTSKDVLKVYPAGTK